MGTPARKGQHIMATWKIVSLFVFTMIVAVVAGVPALAVDRVVNAEGTGEYSTIDDAVGACSHGDQVLLMPGTYTGVGNHDIQVEADITIKPHEFMSEVIIDCQGSELDNRRAFNVVDGSPTFRNLTIKGGYETNGGAIAIMNYTTTIIGCRFIDNRAERGGAIYADRADALNLEICLFSKNHASIEGGGVYATGNFPVSVDRATFYRNFANAGSGLFLTNQTTLDISESLILLGSGGAAVGDYYGGTQTAVECDIWGNVAGDWMWQLAPQLGVNGNIHADPLLCDPDADVPNFQLSANSPAYTFLNAMMGSDGIDFDWDVPVYGVRADGSGMFPTIQAALDTVPVPGEVVLAAGRYEGVGNTGLTFLGKNVMMRSRDLNAETTVISGSGQHDRVIWLRDGETTAATISHLTIEQGNADFSSDYPGYGGGILLTGAEVTLRGCVIQFNQGAHAAGISLNNEINDLVIEDCEIARNGDLNLYFHGNRLDVTGTLFWNYAGRSDVGIWTGDFANDVNVENCEFINFEKAVHIDHPFSSATFDFVGNTFSEGESAMTIEGADNVVLDGNTFTRRRNNGALTIVDSHVRIVSSDFDGCNRSLEGGGALNADNSWVFMERCELTSNYSEQNGGAIHAVNSNIFLNHSVFTNNQCIGTAPVSNGGAVFTTGGSLSLYRSFFDGNLGDFGAAVYCENASFYCLDAEFARNHGSGPGILNVHHGGATAEITGATFADNTVDSGSVIYVNAATVTFEESTITDNSGSAGYAQIEFNGANDLIFNQNIVAFGVGVSALYVAAIQGTVDLACNDLYGNDGGDYVGSVGVWQGVAGNISEDPYFCDPGVYLFTLQQLSPCLAANNTCGVDIGAFGYGCPQVTATPDDIMPRAFTLEGNSPNPFNPRTEIRFSLPVASQVELDIHDVSGRKVRSLLTGQVYAAGTHEISWEGKDHAGRAVPSGTYLYRVTVGERTLTGKMLLVR